MEASTLRPRPCMHASPALAALVLIVEDEAEIADILCAYLEREGLRTLRAAARANDPVRPPLLYDN